MRHTKVHDVRQGHDKRTLRRNVYLANLQAPKILKGWMWDTIASHRGVYICQGCWDTDDVSISRRYSKAYFSVLVYCTHEVLVRNGKTGSSGTVKAESRRVKIRAKGWSSGSKCPLSRLSKLPDRTRSDTRSRTAINRPSSKTRIRRFSL